MVVADAASGDRTLAVQAAQGASLGPVRQSGGAVEVEFTGCVQHDPVTHHDSVDVGVAGQLGEHAGRNLDGDRPLRHRTGPMHGGVGVGVDDHDIFGSTRPTDGGGGVDERDEGVAGEELVFLDRIGRAPVGHVVGEHRLDRGRQP